MVTLGWVNGIAIVTLIVLVFLHMNERWWHHDITRALIRASELPSRGSHGRKLALKGYLKKYRFLPGYVKTGHLDHNQMRLATHYSNNRETKHPPRERVQDFNKLQKVVSNSKIPDTRDLGPLFVTYSVKAGMNLLLVSHGGVSSNNFADYLERFGLHIKTTYWHTNLCHFPTPPKIKNNREDNNGNALKMAIYLHGDPILAICSMIRQGNNQMNLEKLTGKSFQAYSDKALLRAMYDQFKAWITADSSELGYRIGALHFHQALNQTCINNIFTKMQMPVPSVPRTYRARLNSNRQKCLEILKLDSDDLKLADEINEFRSHSIC